MRIVLLLSFVVVTAAACATEAPPGASVKRAARTVMPFELAAPPPGFAGTITEVVPAGGYTYLRVDHAWVVSLKKPFAIGDEVKVKPFGLAAHFQSKKLGRSFDQLHFAVVTVAPARG